MSTIRPPKDFPAGQGKAANIARTRSPAVLASLLIHAAMFVLLLHQVAPAALQSAIRFIPVELVLLTDRTTAPVPATPELPKQQLPPVRPQTKKAPSQLVPLSLPAQTPVTPQTGSEPVPLPPQDALQGRLEAFAKLRIPGDAAMSAAGSGAALGPSGYDVKDFIRAQVERRWSLNLDSLEDQMVTVSIHVVLTPDGVIRKAEIVNDRGTGAAYHSLAISARNAVILSSPIALPAGIPGSMLDMVLTLSPKDALN